jgi:hypothetical protein
MSHGALAQLGERRLCKPEVTGSIPVRSTKKGPGNRAFFIRWPFCHASRSLGYGNDLETSTADGGERRASLFLEAADDRGFVGGRTSAITSSMPTSAAAALVGLTVSATTRTARALPSQGAAIAVCPFPGRARR